MVYPLALGPLVLSWSTDNITDTTFCFQTIERKFYSSEDTEGHQGLCECPTGQKGVWDLLRNSEFGRGTITKKGGNLER